MSKVVAFVCCGALALVAVGCGGAGSARDANAASAEGLLVTTRDLSGATETKEPPPEECGPLPVLKENGGETAISKTLKLGGVKLVEAVGVFESSREATAALTDLNERTRLECIGGAIKSLGSASTVRIIRPRPLEAGDEASVVHFHSFNGSAEEGDGSEAEPAGYSDVVAVRVGHCTASLLIAADSGGSLNAVSGETAQTAAGRLADSCAE